MDIKNIHPFKLLWRYGLFGTLISLVSCLITTFVVCGETSEQKDIYDYICKIQYDNKKYFDSFIVYYYSFEGNNEILKNIFATLFFFVQKYYSIKIIEHFTPIHLIFSFTAYYFAQKIILIISTAIRRGKNNYKV
jgi:hypothetical protein